MEEFTLPISSANASALKDEELNFFLKCSNCDNRSGDSMDLFLLFEKNVSIIPSLPFIPPRSNASNKSTIFPCVSVSVFPNTASSLFFVENIILVKRYAVETYLASVENAILYHMEWYFHFIYVII